jgi:hypothetical protein
MGIPARGRRVIPGFWQRSVSLTLSSDRRLPPFIIVHGWQPLSVQSNGR